MGRDNTPLLENKQAFSLIRLFFIVSLLFLSAFSAMADDWESLHIAPIAEVNLYGRSSPVFGDGLSWGYGDWSVIGMKGIYGFSLFDDEEKLSLIEVLFYLRFFIVKGFFLEINGGPVVLFTDTTFNFPFEVGSFSIGLQAGYRFLIGKRFFIEPYIRGGFPYYGGAGLSFGWQTISDYN